VSVLAEQLVAFGVQATLVSAPLALGLAVAFRLDKQLHPRARYLLACAFFILAPALAPLIMSRTTDLAIVPESAGPALRSAVASTRGNGEPGTPIDTAAASVWLAVAIVLAVREFGGHVLLSRRHRGLTSQRHVAKDGRTTTVHISRSGVPMTIGLLRTRVVIPSRAMEELSGEALEAVVAHEAAHARWRDPLVHAVMRIIRFTLWPIVPLHLIASLAAREAETAADLSACSADRDRALEYANLLVESARWQRTAPSALALSLTGIALEARIRKLLEPATPSRRGALFAALALASSALVTSAVPSVRPDSGLGAIEAHLAEPQAQVAPEPTGLAARALASESDVKPAETRREPIASPVADRPVAVALDFGKGLGTETSSLPGVRSGPPQSSIAPLSQTQPDTRSAASTNADPSPQPRRTMRPPDDERIVVRTVIRNR